MAMRWHRESALVGIALVIALGPTIGPFEGVFLGRSAHAQPRVADDPRAGLAPGSFMRPDKPDGILIDRESFRDSGLEDELEPAAGLSDVEGALRAGQIYAQRRDYEKALPLLRRAADAGDAEANFELGMAAREGYWRYPPDMEEAIRRFRMAVELGYGPAGEAELGVQLYWAYLGGHGDHLEEAVAWFQRAADAGEAEGIRRLAIVRLDQGPPWKDIEQGVALFKRCADMAYGPCLNAYGHLLEQGHGVPQDRFLAMAYFEASRLAEQPSERGELDVHSMRKTLPPESYEDSKPIAEQLLAGDLQAVNERLTAARAGATETPAHQSPHVGIRPAETIGKRSAGHNYIDRRNFEASAFEDALDKAATAYETRRPDDALAILAPLDQADPNVLYLTGLARMAKPGHANLTAGLELLEPAIAAGHRQAMSSLGLLLVTGADGVAKDKWRGLELLRRAGDLGDVEGALRTGQFYGNGYAGAIDNEKALHYLRIATDGGSGEGAHVLSAFTKAGVGMEKDDAEAFRLLELSAERGYAPAQAVVGLHYYNEFKKGWIGDLEKPLHWLALAAEAGDADSIRWLAVIRLNEEPPWEDRAAGVALTKRCADMAHGPCLYMYGQILERGFGIDPDPGLALAYYKASYRASQPQVYAQETIGRLEQQLDPDQVERARSIAGNLLPPDQRRGL